MPTIDPQLVVDVAIAAAAVAGWLVLLGVALLLTVPRAGAALPPTQEFPGDEPPAVVSLITGGWALTEHASESTLLDLAARRHLELRQPGNDPRHTTIHLGAARPTGLNAYEQRVFDRVADLAVRGVVPLTALTFRDAGQALQWRRRLHAEVVADARTRGLSRRRISPAVVALLTFAALGPAAAVALAVMRAQQRGGHPPDYYWVLMAAVMTVGFLSSTAGRPWGERDTPRGREAAARWLGLKAYLRRDGNFADLPPSAVAVWDRYLSYGDALGVTRLCATVLDLGLGNRRRVWSSFGGTWHQVRVRYPRLWPRYGQVTWELVVKGMLALGAAYALLRYRPVILGFEVPVGPDGLPRTALQILIPVLVAYSGYTVLAAVATALTPVTVTGEVLWLQVWRSSRPDGDKPPVPWLFHLALDDGRRDRTVAWALPTPLAGSFGSGDVVTIRARRWTRRIIELRVTGRREQRQVTAAAADSRPPDPDAAADALLTGIGLIGSAMSQALATATAAPPVQPGLLLTEAEVSRGLGMDVYADRTDVVPPTPFATQAYLARDTGRHVMVVTVAHGPIGELSARRGQLLPGIGDVAYAGNRWATARRGDTLVRLTLHDAGRAADPRGLHWLLSLAAGRLPEGVGTA